jgi:hypothetical protein
MSNLTWGIDVRPIVSPFLEVDNRFEPIPVRMNAGSLLSINSALCTFGIVI